MYVLLVLGPARASGQRTDLVHWTAAAWHY